MTSTTTPKKLTSLSQLVSEKTAVETSCGKLYVRTARSSELREWDHLEVEDLGRSVLQQLCGHVQDKLDETGLCDQTLGALDKSDISRLVQAIAEQERWNDRPQIEDFKELGLAFQLQLDKKNQALQERLMKSFEPSKREVLEAVKPFIPPRPEDTPVGRAMVQSAKELQQIKALALKADSGSAEAERIARKSLKIAVWTLAVAVVGVIVAVAPLLLTKKSDSEIASDKTVQPSRSQTNQERPQAATAQDSKPSGARSETEDTNKVHETKATPEIH